MFSPHTSQQTSSSLKLTLDEFKDLPWHKIIQVDESTFKNLVEMDSESVTAHILKEVTKLSNIRMQFVNHNRSGFGMPNYKVPIKSSQNKDHPYYKNEESMQRLGRYVSIAAEVLRSNYDSISDTSYNLHRAQQLIYSPLTEVEGISWPSDHHSSSPNNAHSESYDQGQASSRSSSVYKSSSKHLKESLLKKY